MMKFVNVYTPWYRPDARRLLYKLLGEREPHQCISHKRMPTLEAHVKFVDSQPYAEWYVIEVHEVQVGAIYLTHDNEIGIGILQAHRGKGYANEAILRLKQEHFGERLLANVAPGNAESAALFKNLGFKCIQHTYALDPS